MDPQVLETMHRVFACWDPGYRQARFDQVHRSPATGFSMLAVQMGVIYHIPCQLLLAFGSNKKIDGESLPTK